MSPATPLAAAHLPISTSSSVTSAAGYGLRSPITSACEMYFEALRSFSMFWGAMFLPPAVTMMSFLRSVIFTKPSSSISAMSPDRSQPSSLEHLRRRLGILVVAAEDRLAPDQQLAVVGRPQLESGQRGTDGAEAPALGSVRRRGRRALRQPVALEDPDPDGIEELGDLLHERGAAGDGRAQAATQPLSDLREHEPVGNPVLRSRSRPPTGRPAASSWLTLATDADRPVGESLLTPVASSIAATTAVWIFS